jgi:hypothetical protein
MENNSTQKESNQVFSEKVLTPEQYKKEQQKRMDLFKIGVKDHLGNTVKNIFTKSDEYVVYEIETTILSDSLKVLVDPFVEDNIVPIENLTSVKPKFAELKGLLYKVDDIDTMKSRIGSVLPLFFHHPDQANEELEKLKGEINKRYKELFKFRMYFLITSLFCVFIAIISSICCYYGYVFTGQSQLKTFIYLLTGGGIGGLISTSIRLRNISFESGIKNGWYIFYGFQRIVISMFFGIIIYFAIRTNSIFGFVNDLHKPIFGYIVFSIVAGFSETLIPTLLINLENKKDKENKSNPPK